MVNAVFYVLITLAVCFLMVAGFYSLPYLIDFKKIKYKTDDILVLYPTRGERKHVSFQIETLSHIAEVICGVGKPTKAMIDMMANYEKVVLFGCAGMADSLDLFSLYTPRWIVYKKDTVGTDFCIANEVAYSAMADSHVKSIEGYEGCALVDQESYWYAHVCDSLNRPFSVIRYGSDRYGKKLFPKPLNYIGRKFQHFISQKRFSWLINEWRRDEY